MKYCILCSLGLILLGVSCTTRQLAKNSMNIVKNTHDAIETKYTDNTQASNRGLPTPIPSSEPKSMNEDSPKPILSPISPKDSSSPDISFEPENNEQRTQKKAIWLDRPIKAVEGTVSIHIAPNGSRFFVPCKKDRWEPWLLEEEGTSSLLKLPWHQEPSDDSPSVFAHVKGLAQISKEGRWQGSDGKFYRFRVKFISVTVIRESCP